MTSPSPCTAAGRSRRAAQRALLVPTVVAAAAWLAGCAATENFLGGERVDYRSQASKTPSLEVPPDLTQLTRDGRYRPQGSGPVSASQAASAAATTSSAAAVQPQVALQSLGDIRVERAGSQRWLVVPMTPEQLWPQLQAFWAERGFNLEVQDAQAGVMETGWAENRAKLPQDLIRRTIGKVLEGLYSTSERDRFRTRVERAPGGGSEVYISHRGLVETFKERQGDSTLWQPRPADPQLEAEFLSRLMIKLGTKEDVARTAVANAAEKAPAAQPAAVPAISATNATNTATAASGATALEVADGFDRAWRRVGLALDRSGFTVEDRDRAAGLYFVRYLAPGAPAEEGNFITRLFKSAPTVAPKRYRVVVKQVAEGRSAVSVQNSQGAPETGDDAKRIVGTLLTELR